MSHMREKTRMSLGRAEMCIPANIATLSYGRSLVRSSTSGRRQGGVLHRYGPVTSHYGSNRLCGALLTARALHRPYRLTMGDVPYCVGGHPPALSVRYTPYS